MSFFKNIAIAATLLLGHGAASAGPAFDCIPSATTQCITFDDNAVPTGWTLVNNLNNGRNSGIAGGQLYIGQIDTNGGIYQAFNSIGVSRVNVDFDSNITSNYWGQGAQVSMFSSMSNTTPMAFSNASAEFHKSGYGEYTQQYNIGYTPAGGQGSNLVHQPDDLNVGNYHMSASFQDGQISMTVSRLETNGAATKVFATSVAIPTFLLSTMKDLYVGGYDTTGPPTVIDNVKIVKTLAAPINGAPPSVMTLAQLSKDVYNNPSDQQGAPDGNMTKLPYNEKGAEGFQASVYFNSTTNQIVVAVRGTKDGKLSAHPGAAWKNTAADIALTPNGELNPLLTSYVEQLSKLVLTVSQDHPGIPVTLTGHSLGGAVAQIVGAIKNVDTISFDAPGSSNLLFQKISDTQTLSQLVQANIPNAVTTNSGLMKTAVNIVNYRLQGDVVSLSGYDDSTGTSTQEGQTITVKNPLIVDDSGIGGASYPGYLDNHELSNLIGAMQQYCPGRA